MLEYKVEVVPPFKVNNVVVSSSQIRSLLQEGRLARANHLLNHPYSLSGKVIHGEHRGHGLGFPTANLQIPADRLIPAKGVYATRAIVHDKVYTSVTNIGVRPTFENPLEFPRVEPHILDLEEDLYGQEVKLELVDYLRPEIAFNNSTELIAQVQLDIQKAREVIENGQ